MKVPYVGLEEIKGNLPTLFKQLTAEFIGTLLLVLIGCGSCMGASDDGDSQAKITRIAFCFGVTVATLAQCLGHVSGCHINPAVTAGLATGAKIGLLKGLLYIIAQSVGATAGAVLLAGLVSEKVEGAGGLGTTGISPSISVGQAFGIEWLITLVLVLTVYGAAADENNATNVKGSAPLAIGLSITTCHLFAIPLTGSSMNPARTLGPALITGQLGDLWVYWAAPILGGVAAGLIYQLALQAPPKQEYKAVAKDEKMGLESI